MYRNKHSYILDKCDHSKIFYFLNDAKIYFIYLVPLLFCFKEFPQNHWGSSIKKQELTNCHYCAFFNYIIFICKKCSSFRICKVMTLIKVKIFCFGCSETEIYQSSLVIKGKIFYLSNTYHPVHGSCFICQCVTKLSTPYIGGTVVLFFLLEFAWNLFVINVARSLCLCFICFLWSPYNKDGAVLLFSLIW